MFTLAIGKGNRATDAYGEENEYVAYKLAEAESVAARKATLLDPSSERETVQVLRRRLFSRIDQAGAAEWPTRTGTWSRNAGDLPAQRINEDRAADLLAGHPFHVR